MKKKYTGDAFKGSATGKVLQSSSLCKEVLNKAY